MKMKGRMQKKAKVAQHQLTENREHGRTQSLNTMTRSCTLFHSRCSTRTDALQTLLLTRQRKKSIFSHHVPPSAAAASVEEATPNAYSIFGARVWAQSVINEESGRRVYRAAVLSRPLKSPANEALSVRPHSLRSLASTPADSQGAG